MKWEGREMKDMNDNRASDEEFHRAWLCNLSVLGIGVKGIGFGFWA